MVQRYARQEQDRDGPAFLGDTVAAMTLGQRLRAAIDRKNVSHAWVAEEIGMTAGSLSLILSGKTEDPGFFTVLAIVRVINEPLSAIVDDPLTYWSADDLKKLNELGQWLAERSTRQGAGHALEIPPRKKSRSSQARVVPVAATPGVALDPDAFEARKQRIPAKYARAHATAVFSVQGESMIDADIFPGDLLYVRRTPDPAEALNQIVVCTLDEMILVKRLRARGRKLVLESANEQFKPLAVDENSSRFRLIGVVVGSSRDAK